MPRLRRSTRCCLGHAIDDTFERSTEPRKHRTMGPWDEYDLRIFALTILVGQSQESMDKVHRLLVYPCFLLQTACSNRFPPCAMLLSNKKIQKVVAQHVLCQQKHQPSNGRKWSSLIPLYWLVFLEILLLNQ